MGLLAQAKNGDEQFWKGIFHAANGKAQHAFIFFLLSLGGGGGGRGFFFFFPLFPTCSLQVPSGFPIAPHFNPMCFAQSSPLLTYIVGRHSIFPQNLLFWGAFIVSTFFCDGPMKSAHCKKKNWTCEAPQLINMKQHKYPPEYSVIVISGTYYIHVKLCYIVYTRNVLHCDRWNYIIYLPHV